MFTKENTEGYSSEDLKKLNDEFEERWNSGYYSHLKHFAQQDQKGIAKKEFSDEVSKR